MNILVVDDHQLILDGFVAAVRKAHPDFHVFTASDHTTLFECLVEHGNIDVLFLDIRLQHSDARSFVKTLRVNYSKLKIIIISSMDDLPTIETLFKQGVDGYLLKADPKSEIMRAIHVVREGGKFVSKGIEERYFSQSLIKPKQLLQLTPREKEILSHILAGKTTKEIAQTVFLSEKTIENHRSSLFIKFDVKNVAGLVREAILQGYL